MLHIIYLIIISLLATLCLFRIKVWKKRAINEAKQVDDWFNRAKKIFEDHKWAKMYDADSETGKKITFKMDKGYTEEGTQQTILDILDEKGEKSIQKIIIKPHLLAWPDTSGFRGRAYIPSWEKK